MTVRVGLSSVACFYMVSLAPGTWDIKEALGLPVVCRAVYL